MWSEVRLDFFIIPVEMFIGLGIVHGIAISKYNI
jgi:hypothetical protein